ncbi:hypothetical protein N665_0861s0011 [Sinapis alba]|nr:hypothetical protein N665_0861s0011 [Sinapis alba]
MYGNLATTVVNLEDLQREKENNKERWAKRRDQEMEENFGKVDDGARFILAYAT